MRSIVHCPMALLIGLSVVASESHLGAATWTVCSSGCDYTSIQTAIFAADAFDTVLVQVEGEHTEGPIVVIKDITIEGLGRDITVVQQAVDPILADRAIFQVGLGAEVIIRDMTIRYGRDDMGGCILNNSANLLLHTVSITACEADNGGAILNLGELTVVESQIWNNEADFGGGIFNDDNASLLLEGSVVEGNGASTYGGGLFNQGQSFVFDSQFIANRVIEIGGGIANNGFGDLLISHSEFRSNTADFGEIGAVGGAVSNEGSLSVEDSSFSDNSSSGRGGAIYLSSLSNQGITISRTTFSENKAKDGGALWLSYPLDLANTTFSANEADRHGGAIYVVPGVLVRLANVTVTENVADADGDGQGDGGGIFASDNTRLKNSLIVGNHDLTHPAFHNAPNCEGSLASDGYNLIGNTGYTVLGGPAACFVSGAPGTDDVGVAETLGPLLDNGGPTLTHAILPGGLAVDMGTPGGCASYAGFPLDVDQRGYLRPNRCDRGAFERGALGPGLILFDGFESGSTSQWSDEMP